MKTNEKISRQLSLFDDESTDKVYYKKELSRLRKLRIKQKEKAFIATHQNNNKFHYRR